VIRVKIRGLDGFQHDLSVAETRLVEGVRDLMSDLAREAASDARTRADRGKLTGASRDSIRALGPVIRAGQNVPWYGFADFGGRVGLKRSIHREYIKGGRYLFPAVRDLGVYKKADRMVDKATEDLRK
jgi:hypothetical protein